MKALDSLCLVVCRIAPLLLLLLSAPLLAAQAAVPALKVGDPAGGDLEGNYPNPVIRAGVLKSCRIEYAQESNFDETIEPGGGTLSVLTMPVTVKAGQLVKLDAMMRVKFNTDDASTAYRYIISYAIHKNGVFIASATDIGEDDNTTGKIRDMIRVLPLTWVDDSGTEGDHSYELTVHIAQTSLSHILQAWVVGARSLNAMVCDS